MLTKKDLIEHIINDKESIIRIIQDKWRTWIIKKYHCTWKTVLNILEDYNLDHHTLLNWMQIAIRDEWKEFVKEKYESLNSLRFIEWIRTNYGSSGSYISKKALLELYDWVLPNTSEKVKKMQQKAKIETRTLNKWLWDRTEVKPYWLNEWEIVEVGRWYIPGVKLNPYSWVPIIL